VQAQLQFIKGKGALDRNGELAIEHETFCGQFSECLDHVGKIAGEWLAGLRLQKNFFAVPKSNAPETIPLRLVLPFVADGNFIDGARFHRR
jgi:hypothetical protein